MHQGLGPLSNGSKSKPARRLEYACKPFSHKPHLINSFPRSSNMRLLLTAVIVSAGFMLGQAAVAADADAGAAKFKQLCATCHGDSGHGDGPASAALNPKPRDMTDHEWQESVDDDHIRTVIKDGGAAVGLSPTMTAFGHALSEEDLDNLVAFIRRTDD